LDISSLCDGSFFFTGFTLLDFRVLVDEDLEEEEEDDDLEEEGRMVLYTFNSIF
jgi:hypothetical protein